MNTGASVGELAWTWATGEHDRCRCPPRRSERDSRAARVRCQVTPRDSPGVDRHSGSVP
jgi:hypothetical protein